MDIQNYINNYKLSLRVIPHSSQLKLVKENSQLKIYLTAVADDNKANLQLIKFFKKEYGLKVRIVSGMKSRDKVIEIVQ